MGEERKVSLVYIYFQAAVKPLIPFIGTVDEDDFFNMIRAGGVVSKA